MFKMPQKVYKGNCHRFSDKLLKICGNFSSLLKCCNTISQTKIYLITIFIEDFIF
jgi:hypothetical protein